MEASFVSLKGWRGLRQSQPWSSWRQADIDVKLRPRQTGRGFDIVCDSYDIVKSFGWGHAWTQTYASIFPPLAEARSFTA